MTDRPAKVMQKTITKLQPKEPVLLLGARMFELYELMHDDPYGPSVSKTIKTYDNICRLGCNTRILAPPAWSIRALAYFDDIEKQRPNALLRLDRPFDCPEGKIAYWPRDMFQTYGDLAIASQDNYSVTKEILSKLGVFSFLSGPICSDRHFGEGGFVVRYGNVLVVPDHLESNPRINNEIGKMGYESFFLPSFTGGADVDEHLDMVFNLVSSPDGNLLAVVDGNYHRRYSKEVVQLVKRINAKLHIIENIAEAYKRATNFICLPGGKVIMHNGCASTQMFLERGLGKKNVLVMDLTDDFFTLNRSGGIRCMSNLIE